MYRGRATENWYYPFNVNPANAENGTRLPLVLSITCATMALDPYDSMVGRAWVFTGTPDVPKGAVAFFGSTHSDVNVAAKRSALARGVFTSLFTDDRNVVGDMLLGAKEYLHAQYPGDLCKEDYRGFNLFGDPALRLWTGEPRVLDVEHPDELRPGPSQVVVTVRHQGQPVPGAFVCASMDSSVHAVDTTDAQGRVEMSISPPEGTLRLVVTGTNIYPYEASIPVVITGVAELPALPRPSGLTITPNPARDHVLLAIAGADGPVPVQFFDATGRMVGTLVLTGEETRVSVRGLRPGVYLLRAGTITRRLVVSD